MTACRVIAPAVDAAAAETAPRLKARSGTDTDVGAIAAEDLKWAAEEWADYAKSRSDFTLQAFNYTGVLDRQILQQRMKLFLG